MFLSPSAIINSWALAASNISKQRENNSSAVRKGGSPAGSYVCTHLGLELEVKHVYISNLRPLMKDQLVFLLFWSFPQEERENIVLFVWQN